jgi:hypothetical protein
LCWLVPLRVVERLEPFEPLGDALRALLKDRVGALARPRLAAVALLALRCSWQLQGFAGAGAAGAALPVPRVAATPRSVRVRSREVLARLPERLRASRRESTSSRLGLETGRGVRRGLALGADSVLAWGREETGADAAAAGRGLLVAAAAGSWVREGRASATVRTRPGAELWRLRAFLPALVRALRRSRAASRLD